MGLETIQRKNDKIRKDIPTGYNEYKEFSGAKIYRYEGRRNPSLVL
jgi:hypothetical protein